jgi:hypothetical protein
LIPDHALIQQEGDAGVSENAQGGLRNIAGTTASTTGGGSGAVSDPSSNELPMRPVGTKATRAQRWADERVQMKVRALEALISTLDARNSLKRVQLRMLLAANPETDPALRVQLREEVSKDQQG